MIKTEKELVRLIWKDLGLEGHNANLKRRASVAKEVHKAVVYVLGDLPPEHHEEMFDALAEMFTTRIDGMRDEDFTKAFYTNLLSSIIHAKKKP